MVLGKLFFKNWPWSSKTKTQTWNMYSTVYKEHTYSIYRLRASLRPNCEAIFLFDISNCSWHIIEVYSLSEKFFLMPIVVWREISPKKTQCWDGLTLRRCSWLTELNGHMSPITSGPLPALRKLSAKTAIRNVVCVVCYFYMKPAENWGSRSVIKPPTVVYSKCKCKYKYKYVYV